MGRCDNPLGRGNGEPTRIRRPVQKYEQLSNYRATTRPRGRAASCRHVGRGNRRAAQPRGLSPAARGGPVPSHSVDIPHTIRTARPGRPHESIRGASARRVAAGRPGERAGMPPMTLRHWHDRGWVAGRKSARSVAAGFSGPTRRSWNGCVVSVRGITAATTASVRRSSGLHEVRGDITPTAGPKQHGTHAAIRRAAKGENATEPRKSIASATVRSSPCPSLGAGLGDQWHME